MKTDPEIGDFNKELKNQDVRSVKESPESSRIVDSRATKKSRNDNPRPMIAEILKGIQESEDPHTAWDGAQQFKKEGYGKMGSLFRALMITEDDTETWSDMANLMSVMTEKEMYAEVAEFARICSKDLIISPLMADLVEKRMRDSEAAIVASEAVKLIRSGKENDGRRILERAERIASKDYAKNIKLIRKNSFEIEKWRIGIKRRGLIIGGFAMTMTILAIFQGFSEFYKFVNNPPSITIPDTGAITKNAGEGIKIIRDAGNAIADEVGSIGKTLKSITNTSKREYKDKQEEIQWRRCIMAYSVYVWIEKAQKESIETGKTYDTESVEKNLLGQCEQFKENIGQIAQDSTEVPIDMVIVNAEKFSVKR